jgi:integrase/recombinase XerD
MIIRENYFDVMAYLDYQEKVMQANTKTIRRKWAHLRHLLEWADNVAFPEVDKIELVLPQYLLANRNDGKSEELSPATMKRICGEARRFFQWLKMSKPGKYGRLSLVWIETIRPSRMSDIQSNLVEREYYTLEEVRRLISIEPERLVDKRDRAAVAMLFISGMRISAFATLPVYCVDVEEMVIDQLPSEGVETKNSKAARTYLLPLQDLLEVVRDWDKLVRSELGEKGLWYPNLATDGMSWKNGGMGKTESRRVAFSRGLKRFCERAGVDYKSPHKLRNGHGVYGVKNAKTTEKFKAFSQNMMHESMEITDRLYAGLASDDVREIISSMGGEVESKKDEELFKHFIAFKKWMDEKG